MSKKPAPSRYGYVFGHTSGTRVLACLNDVPFYRSEGTDSPESTSGVADHLLVEGENTFTMEVSMASSSAYMFFQIYPNEYRERPVTSAKWPDVIKSIEPKDRTLPYTHSQSFRVQGLGFEPTWVRAPASTSDAAADEALWAAVQRVQSAIARRDTDAVVGELSTKTAEYSRAYPHEPNFSEVYVRKSFDRFFESEPTVRPLRREDVAVRSSADGRVAYVTRRDGGTAIAATSSKKKLERDMWFTRQGGDWRLFR